MQTDDRPATLSRGDQMLLALTSSLAMVVLAEALAWWVLRLASPV
jgi:hypothetical protein